MSGSRSPPPWQPASPAPPGCTFRGNYDLDWGFHQLPNWDIAILSNMHCKNMSSIINPSVWGGRLRKRFCNMFSESSTGSWAELQLPCCPSKQGELQENMLQNLFLKLPPQTVPWQAWSLRLRAIEWNRVGLWQRFQVGSVRVQPLLLRDLAADEEGGEQVVGPDVARHVCSWISQNCCSFTPAQVISPGATRIEEFAYSDKARSG